MFRKSALALVLVAGLAAVGYKSGVCCSGDPWQWAAFLGVSALFLGVFLGPRRGAEQDVPPTWGSKPRPSPDEFSKDHSALWDHVPVDDLVEHWTDRLPEGKVPRRTASPKEKRAGTGIEWLGVAGPPPCARIESKYERVPACSLWRRRWVRVKGEHIAEAVGAGAIPGTLKVRHPDGTHEDIRETALEPAYPRKGEIWLQRKCSICAIPAEEEIVFFVDDIPNVRGRADCGCLRPLNYGRGFARP